MRPILALFRLTAYQTLVQRKVWFALLLVLLPAGIALLVRKLAGAEVHKDYWMFYHMPVQMILYTLTIPLLSVLYGTALVGTEVESRTIIYLLTRRMRRSTVLLVRFAAVALILTVLGEAHSNWQPARDLACYASVLPFAVVTYLAVFTAVGLALSRSLALSVIYLLFGDIMLGNAPVGARVLSISHQVRLTMVHFDPGIKYFYKLSQQMNERVFPEGATGIPWLALITAAGLILGCILMTLRELQPTKLARD
jgi:ABC-2 type transport system permease protein